MSSLLPASSKTTLIRKALPELLAAFLMCLMAAALSDAPQKTTTNDFSSATKKAAVHISAPAAPAHEVTETGKSLGAIEKRNIFSVDGKYFLTADSRTLPEKPYEFIAVLKGAEETAVFKDYTGKTHLLKAGQKLLDDSVVYRINNDSVLLKKDGNVREFSIRGGLKTRSRLKKLPDKPYNLIAVLQGAKNSAIFKDVTGSIIVSTTGERLIDGAVVTFIGKDFVKIKRGGKESEQRIFYVEAGKN